MALRNAFGELALESTLRKILAAVTYARTPQDAMRVNVENTTTTADPARVYASNLNGVRGTTAPNNLAATFVPWFDVTAVFQVDEREQQRIQSEQQFAAVRQGRWTF